MRHCLKFVFIILICLQLKAILKWLLNSLFIGACCQTWQYKTLAIPTVSITLEVEG